MANKITIVKGDITGFKGDAIVNAANPALAPGSGVCGAIFAAAGPYLHEEIQKFYGKHGCHTGDAVLTNGYDLPARYIIHAVGPIWRGGKHGESLLLTSAYLRSMEVSWNAGCRSIAFPAISTGVYGYPADLAAGVAVSTVAMGLTRYTDMSVSLYAFDHETFKLYERTLGNLT